MQDSGQAQHNAEQAKPRTTNQLDYIKKIVFKSVAKHKHAWPFQVREHKKHRHFRYLYSNNTVTTTVIIVQLLWLKMKDFRIDQGLILGCHRIKRITLRFR